jgi:2-amino-4-hydroxy-6-hydroxymethyldihydropteridine diphosphokinase
VGFADQPRFVNAVVELETALSPRELLNGLMALELEFGRNRSAGVQNGPRTLDLDILLFGDLEVSEPDLEIPHPRLKERAFVLVPLLEIAPRIFDTAEIETVPQFPHISGKKCESGADAVVLIQWSGWRAGPGDARPGAS